MNSGRKFGFDATNEDLLTNLFPSLAYVMAGSSEFIIVRLIEQIMVEILYGEAL